MKHDLVIKDGKLVTANEAFITDVGIKGGKITTMGENLDGYYVIKRLKKIGNARWH